MSKDALAKVVQRAISDASFRRQLSSDTAGALRGFDLTPDEVSALRAGDAGRLSTLGVDQRMSKSFALGGMAAATRMAQSDLTAGNAAAFDDGAAGVGRTIIPHDPESSLTDDPDGFLAANARPSGGTGSVRIGDDWKYADKSVAQGSVAPVDGSSSGARTVNDDPDGFLAANANADLSVGSAGDGTAFVDDSQDPAYLSTVGYDASAASAASANASTPGALETVHGPGGARDPFANADDSQDPAYLSTVGYDASAASANADVTGGSSAETTAFIDESEAYLAMVGHDSSAATTASTRATWSGDENAGPASVADDDGGASPNGTEGGPYLTP